MARKPREVKTTEQKLTDINNQIAEYESTLKDLKEQKKELQKQLDKEKVEKLLAVIKENNMSVDDATTYIEQLKDSTQTA